MLGAIAGDVIGSRWEHGGIKTTDFEQAVRLAVSLGGDADTLAAIAGSVAEARFGGVPSPIAEDVVSRLPSDVEAILREFRGRWIR